MKAYAVCKRTGSSEAVFIRPEKKYQIFFKQRQPISCHSFANGVSFHMTFNIYTYNN